MEGGPHLAVLEDPPAQAMARSCAKALVRAPPDPQLFYHLLETLGAGVVPFRGEKRTLSSWGCRRQ